MENLENVVANRIEKVKHDHALRQHTVLEAIQAGAKQLTDAKVAFGHGTANAFDEAAWLVLWKAGLPLDSSLDDPKIDANSVANTPLAGELLASIATFIHSKNRIPQTRRLPHPRSLAARHPLLHRRTRHRAAQLHRRIIRRRQF